MRPKMQKVRKEAVKCMALLKQAGFVNEDDEVKTDVQSFWDDWTTQSYLNEKSEESELVRSLVEHWIGIAMSRTKARYS